VTNAISYAGGLFDGEGCVEAYERPQTRGRGVRAEYRPYLVTEIKALKKAGLPG
jgi:hypothetical protein